MEEVKLPSLALLRKITTGNIDTIKSAKMLKANGKKIHEGPHTLLKNPSNRVSKKSDQLKNFNSKLRNDIEKMSMADIVRLSQFQSNRAVCIMRVENLWKEHIPWFYTLILELKLPLKAQLRNARNFCTDYYYDYLYALVAKQKYVLTFTHLKFKMKKGLDVPINFFPLMTYRVESMFVIPLAECSSLKCPICYEFTIFLYRYKSCYSIPHQYSI